MSSELEIGRRFGRLTVTGEAERARYVKCVCDCGTTKDILIRNLMRDATKRCGCLHREQLANRKRTHGATDSLAWKRWRSMISRCTMQNTKSYPRYGGRGIKICDSWRQSFDAFLADMGNCPGSEWTVERDDYNGNYEPGNCRWATRKEQNRNSSHNRMIEFDGQSRCLSEWAEVVGINYRTLATRLGKGWSIHRALTEPVGGHAVNRQFTKTYRSKT